MVRRPAQRLGALPAGVARRMQATKRAVQRSRATLRPHTTRRRGRAAPTIGYIYSPSKGGDGRRMTTRRWPPITSDYLSDALRLPASQSSGPRIGGTGELYAVDEEVDASVRVLVVRRPSWFSWGSLLGRWSALSRSSGRSRRYAFSASTPIRCPVSSKSRMILPFG